MTLPSRMGVGWLNAMLQMAPAVVAADAGQRKNVVEPFWKLVGDDVNESLIYFETRHVVSYFHSR